MMSGHIPARRFWIGCFAVIGLLITGTLSVAAEKLGNALDWVPADASFMSSSLRQREVVEIIGKSNAWKKFKEMPSIVWLNFLIQAQINQNEQVQTLNQLMELPENKQAAALGLDMISNEIVVYSDSSMTGAVDLLMQTMNSIQYANFAEGIKEGVGDKDDDDDDDKKDQGGKLLMEALSKQPELIKVPNLVIAFKITDAAQAKTQLERIEVFAKLALQQQPQLKERLSRVTLGGGDYLTLLIDGKLVPSWDEVDDAVKKLESNPGQYDAVLKKIKELTLSVSLGVRDDYVILSFGSSNDHLARLGQGNTLAQLPEMAPVVAANKSRITGIGYLSKAMHMASSRGKQNVDNLTELARQSLTSSKLDPQLKQRIMVDVEKLTADLKTVVPDEGAVVQYAFLTPRGTEGYTYQHTQSPLLDGSKRLELLNHLGGSPIAAFVARAKYSPEHYDTFVEWAKVAFGYFNEFAPKQMDDEEKAKYEEFKKYAKPLVARLDNATRELLIPSLADGQSAIVLDAKIKSTQWHGDMPKAREALPMIELGLLSGVSNADLFKKAIAEYKAVADEFIVKIREQEPKAIPADYKIPLPEVTKVAGGEVYSYPLKGSGVDPQIAPAAGLSSSVLIVSSSPKQAERVLVSKPLAVGGMLADSSRPLVAAGFLDWAATVDALTPWIDYGIRAYSAKAAAEAGGALMAVDEDGVKKLAAAEEDSPSTKEILDQVHTGLEILSTLRNVTSVTFFEKGITVTHTEVHWQDTK